jgi:hypothetical protein
MRVSTARLWCAVYGIGGRNWDDMFVHMVIVHVVEMAVMEIIDVAVMEDRRMPTVGTMLVSMVGMMLLGAGGHTVLLFCGTWRILSFDTNLHGVSNDRRM